jgi:hypothetical protein
MPPDLTALPRPPERPDPRECCGRGCCPCIMDYYDDSLARWEARVREHGFDPDTVLKAFEDSVAGAPPGAKLGP